MIIVDNFSDTWGDRLHTGRFNQTYREQAIETVPPVPKDSFDRVSGGLIHVLLEAAKKGRWALPVVELIASTVNLLGITDRAVWQALSQMITSGSLVQQLIRGQFLVFLSYLRKAEEGIAARVRALLETQPTYPPIDFEKAVQYYTTKTGKRLNPRQWDAVRTALTRRIVIITGGSGVGQTTVVHSILTILRAQDVSCRLCAPTSRAATRWSEATGMKAKKTRRLLEVQRSTGRFARNESHLLDCDLLVMEAPIADVGLMQGVLKAIPLRASLILIGDVDQLPSEGPGSVFKNLIDGGLVSVVRLTEAQRPAGDFGVSATARRQATAARPEAGDAGKQTEGPEDRLPGQSLSNLQATEYNVGNARKATNADDLKSCSLERNEPQPAITDLESGTKRAAVRSTSGVSEPPAPSIIAQETREAEPVPVATPKPRDRRRRSKDPDLQTLRDQVREMHKLGYSHFEMCRRFGDDPRPPGVGWRKLTWPAAFQNHKYNSAVRKWLSVSGQ
jgi:hypothetical protein